jgi:hypothetical protein
VSAWPGAGQIAADWGTHAALHRDLAAEESSTQNTAKASAIDFRVGPRLG